MSVETAGGGRTLLENEPKAVVGEREVRSERIKKKVKKKKKFKWTYRKGGRKERSDGHDANDGIFKGDFGVRSRVFARWIVVFTGARWG